MTDVIDKLAGWAARARSAQLTLDQCGADRDAVARVAGQLLDLAQDVERAKESAAPVDYHGLAMIRDALDRTLREARDAEVKRSIAEDPENAVKATASSGRPP